MDLAATQAYLALIAAAAARLVWRMTRAEKAAFVRNWSMLVIRAARRPGDRP